MYYSKKKKQNNRFSGGKSTGNLSIEYLDAKDVLDNLGIPHKDSGKNVGQGWIGVCCPFCGDNNFHLGINIQGKTISCFRCGKTGTILTYLSEELRSFNKALEAVKDMLPRELKSFVNSSDASVNKSSLKVELPRGSKRGLRPSHKEYLRYGRKYPILNPDELEDKYNLYSTGPVDEYPNRIIVPVVRNYRLITYTTVSIAEEAMIRYKHLPNEQSIAHVKEYLYNIHTVRHVCYVTEGLFDCWRIGDGAVTTFGTKVTDEQIRLLSAIPNVVLLFDGDAPGRNASTIVSAKLAPMTNVYTINLKEGRDPDSLSPEEVQKIKSIKLSII